MDLQERLEFSKFAKKLDSQDWALPWAHPDYICDEFFDKSELHFARDLEDKGFGLLAPSKELFLVEV